MPEIIKKIFIFLIISGLCVSAFLMRLENMKQFRQWTVDEVVFAFMGRQVSKEIMSYHVVPYGKALAAKGMDLPDYFFQPLFKHPPVFTFLVALSIRIFGASMVSAGYVPLLFAVLMIPLIYFLGSVLFNRLIGLLAAVLLWMDPVSIICSQKIWMDAGIAFFTLSSALCFVLAVKHKKSWLFFLAGIAAGLAANTKYTGILIVGVYMLYAVFYDRMLFKNRRFQFGVLILPVLMLVPWFAWNIHVYGSGNILTALEQHSELQYMIGIFREHIFLFSFLAFVFLFCLIFFKKFLRSKPCHQPTKVLFAVSPSFFQKASGVFAVFFIIGLFHKYIFRSFNLWDFPSGTWYQGVFSNEPPLFYVGRLMEFSAIYILGFLSFLTFDKKARAEEALIRLSAAVILGFFILWGNYQSRYILSAVPFVILLSAGAVMKCVRWAETQPVFMRWTVKSVLVFFIAYALTKTWLINIAFSFPSDMCYF